jgi:hypothetical protein
VGVWTAFRLPNAVGSTVTLPAVTDKTTENTPSVQPTSEITRALRVMGSLNPRLVMVPSIPKRRSSCHRLPEKSDACPTARWRRVKRRLYHGPNHVTSMQLRVTCVAGLQSSRLSLAWSIRALTKLTAGTPQGVARARGSACNGAGPSPDPSLIAGRSRDSHGRCWIAIESSHCTHRSPRGLDDRVSPQASNPDGV